MHRCIPYLAFAAALGCVPALAADREERMPQEYRGGPQRRPPYVGKPLRFKAPPTQLREPWRCDGGDIYARPSANWPCPYEPRLASDFLLDYPFVTLGLMPPLRPVPPPPSLTDIPVSGDTVPAAPPSQLPNN